MAPRTRTFHVEYCLGRGGFGEVYKARMTQPGGLTTSVALKVLLPGGSQETQPVERLRDEGRLLAALEHPVILRAVDVTVLEGRVTLVAEYVAGEDLDGCCAGEVSLGVRGLVQVIGDVASALDAAWSAKTPDGRPLELVHRDIKPSNIRIGRHGEVKLLDFGIARSDAMDRNARTATQMVVGSLPYMAPERFSERGPGPEADVYGLGCCLFQGLTGRVPFPRLDPPQALRLALDAEHFETRLGRALKALPDGVDDRVRQLVIDCMAHDAGARPAAGALADRCEALVQELDGPTLKQWARKRAWADEVPDNGPLAGREITETLGIEQPTAPLPSVEPLAETSAIPVADVAPEPSSGAWRWLVAGGLGIGALALVGGLGGVATGLGYAWMRPGVEAPAPVDGGAEEAPAGEAPAGEAPAEEPADGPGEADPPGDGMAPVPTPEPEVPEPEVPEPKPADPAPQPVTPAPVPRTPSAPATGTVRATGANQVELRGKAGDFGPGAVPAGAYQVHADFGAGLQLAGTVTVVAGETVELSCNPLLENCGVKR